jgi:hypothetical protein
MCVKKHGANAVVQGTQCAFRFAVSSRCIWAREAEGNAITLEELAESKIIELSAIVSPKGENWQMKLTMNIRPEGQKSRNHIRLVHQGKRPDIMRIVIYDHQIVFVS